MIFEKKIKEALRAIYFIIYGQLLSVLCRQLTLIATSV